MAEPTPAQLACRFTPQNAREMAAKANAVRWSRPPEPEPAAAPIVIPVQPPEDTFNKSRLSRVREQLTRLDDMMIEETDPQRLDRLASAQMRLAEQERILDNRPLPGSRRPGREPVRRSSVIAEPEPAGSTPPVVSGDAPPA